MFSHRIWYFIETLNGLVLTLTSDGIILGHRKREESKMWSFDEYGLLHSKTGLVAHIPESSKDTCVRVMGSRRIHGGDNQRFTYDKGAIRSESNDYVFDVEAGVMETGSPIVMKPHHGGGSQAFKIIAIL